MDILLNNEINARTKEVDNNINDFINEEFEEEND